jgi:hypothetical protein
MTCILRNRWQTGKSWCEEGLDVKVSALSDITAQDLYGKWSSGFLSVISDDSCIIAFLVIK